MIVRPSMINGLETVAKKAGGGRVENNYWEYSEEQH